MGELVKLRQKPKQQAKPAEVNWREVVKRDAQELERKREQRRELLKEHQK